MELVEDGEGGDVGGEGGVVDEAVDGFWGESAVGKGGRGSVMRWEGRGGEEEEEEED